MLCVILPCQDKERVKALPEFLDRTHNVYVVMGSAHAAKHNGGGKIFSPDCRLKFIWKFPTLNNWQLLLSCLLVLKQ